MKIELLDKEILHLTAFLKDFPVESFFSDAAAELADCGYLCEGRKPCTQRARRTAGNIFCGKQNVFIGAPPAMCFVRKYKTYCRMYGQS